MVNQKYVKAHLATPKQREELEPIAELLEEENILLTDGDTRIPLQGCILKVFREVVHRLRAGLAVSVSCSDGTVTAAEAIELLGITEKDLLDLVEWQIIPCEIIENHRRFSVSDLLDYLRSFIRKD